MPRSRVDIGDIARQALGSAEQLLAQWLTQGKRVGHEWQCGSLRGEPGESLSVNLSTGRWADFASDDKGGDLVSLYAAIHGLKQGEAARAVAAELGIHIPPARGSTGTAAKPASRPTPRAAEEKPPTDSTTDEDRWSDAGPWPSDGPPPPVAHVVRGRPLARWAYVDAAGQLLGYVCRYATSSGGKEILPLTWSRHPTKGLAWRWRQFDDPRPLYNLHGLTTRASAPVLLVEGEKCAELAQQLLGDAWVVTTWPGGCKAWDKARWGLLAGREVLVWPDCDAKRDKDTQALLPPARQPGLRAAEQIAQRVVALGAAKVDLVDIPAPGAVADGWDVADCIADAQSAAADPRAAVQAWLARRRPPSFHVVGGGKGPPRDGAAQAGGGPPGDDDWRRFLVWDRGGYARHVVNVMCILRNDSAWQGVIAFDEFGQRTMKRRAPPYRTGREGEWQAVDDTLTAAWLAAKYGLMVASPMVTEAVETVAREQAYHPVVEYLRGLSWDGERRLDDWLATYCRVSGGEYVSAVGTYFLRGMVKRVFTPGCKFDYCLVLEGAEGLRKSTLAALLGGQWGSDTPLDLANNREAAAAVHGCWVIEFSEMESVTRAEAHLQKSWLSRTFDQYRPVYSRRTVRVPRQCVFIGTTNETEYIKEGQGARRFWPVTVEGHVDIEGLRSILPQLLAEAVHDIDAGERWYPGDEEQAGLFREQQTARVVQESLIDALHDWVLNPAVDEYNMRRDHGGMFSIADAAYRCLKVSYAQLTRDLQTRIGKAMVALGCERVEKRNGMTRYWYKPPQKVATSGGVRPAQHQSGGDDACPF